MSKYEQNLARQLGMNAVAWERLQADGVADGTELALDFWFNAPRQKRAGELAAALQSRGYEASARRRGSLLRRTWHVEGSTPPLPMTHERLDEWVREMVAAGERCECDFDGWGAWAPKR